MLPLGIKSMYLLPRFGEFVLYCWKYFVFWIVSNCYTILPLYQAAVDSITRSLALEWGTDYAIRVNGIAPGPIEDTAGVSKLAPEEIRSKATDYMAAYKFGEKWDIAMAALYLASDAGQ